LETGRSQRSGQTRSLGLFAGYPSIERMGETTAGAHPPRPACITPDSSLIFSLD
jgi:hypothetical protein